MATSAMPCKIPTVFARPFLTLLLMAALCVSALGLEAIFAVNCGGGRHRDSFGVEYQKDTLGIGTPSDHGKSLIIRRVPETDAILYQTERYHYQDFSYDVPIPGDGEYVLVLKFSEVYFQSIGGKIFDVRLNKRLNVITDLDVFGTAGYAIAHDILVPFTVKGDELEANGDTIDFSGVLNVEFLKGKADNPKVNAIVVYRGKEDDVPKLPELHKPPEQEEVGDVDDQEDGKDERKFHKTSGPKSKNPYASDESWFWPLTGVVAIFFPVLFCLCRQW